MVKVGLVLGFIFNCKHCDSESVVARNATFCHKYRPHKKNFGVSNLHI